MGCPQNAVGVGAGVTVSEIRRDRISRRTQRITEHVTITCSVIRVLSYLVALTHVRVYVHVHPYARTYGWRYVYARCNNNGHTFSWREN